MPTIYDDGWEYDALGMGYGSTAEVSFYTSHARRGAATLELACGTGRLTIPLVQAGAQVVGLDTAPSMLEVARAKAVERGVRVGFVEADMRRFSLERCFDTVFVPNNSLSHLHSLDDIKACFSCVRQHLSVDGRFLVDVFNPSLALLTRAVGVHFPVAEYEASDGRKVVVTETVEYDAASQISHALWHYHREGRPNSVRPLDLRMFFPQELDALLTLNGFVIESKHGDYSGTPFTHSSRQQLVVCRAIS